MNYGCIVSLVGCFVHYFRELRPQGKLGPSYSYALVFLFCACFTSLNILYFSDVLFLFFGIVSLLLFPCASVQDNTRTLVPQSLQPSVLNGTCPPRDDFILVGKCY